MLINLSDWSNQVLSLRLLFNYFLRFLLIFAHFSFLERLFLIWILSLIIDILLNVLLVAKLKRRLFTGRVEMPIGKIGHEADEKKT